MYNNFIYEDVKKYILDKENITMEQFEEDFYKDAIRNKCIIRKILKVFYDNRDLLDSTGKCVIQELFNRDSIFDKFVLVTDGSWVSNRIWFNGLRDKITLTPEFDLDEYEDEYSNFYKLSCKDKIDFLDKNFDVIFLHIPIVNTRNDIIREAYNEMSRITRCSYQYTMPQSIYPWLHF